MTIMADQTTPESTSIPLSRSRKSNLSYEDINTFLESHNLSFLSSAWPTVIYLSVLIAAGVVGNSLVLLVYSRKVKSGATHFYILAMAVCDLATNCFSLSMEVLDIRFRYIFRSDWSCKVIPTFISFLVNLTGFLLVAVAADRQRVICRQLQRTRLASSREHKAVALCVAVSLLFSCPLLGVMGAKEVHLSDTNITEVRCHFVGHSFMIALYVMNLLAVVVAFACTCISYGRIVRHVRMHKKRQRTTGAAFKRGSPNKNDAVQMEIHGDTPGEAAAHTSTPGASVTCTDTRVSEGADPASTSNTHTSRSPDAQDQPAPRTDASTEADETMSSVEAENTMAPRRQLARLCSRLTAGRAGGRNMDQAHFKA